MFVWRLSAGVFRLSCSLLISVVCIPVLPRPRRLKGLFRSPLFCNRPNYSQRTKTCFWPPEVITSPTCYICYIYSYQYSSSYGDSGKRHDAFLHCDKSTSPRFLLSAKAAFDRIVTYSNNRSVAPRLLQWGSKLFFDKSLGRLPEAFWHTLTTGLWFHRNTQTPDRG